MTTLSMELSLVPEIVRVRDGTREFSFSGVTLLTGGDASTFRGARRSDTF